MSVYRQFLDENPTLTAWGWMDIGDPEYPAARQRLIDSKDEWAACLLFMLKNGLGGADTTYGLKHLVERAYKIAYVSQGAAMAAVLMSGDAVERDGVGLRFL